MINAIGGLRARFQYVALAVAAYATVFAMLVAEKASAAADPTTGIDYKADLADPVLSSAKPAVVAGVAILVLLFAVRLGKKLWSKVSS